MFSYYRLTLFDQHTVVNCVHVVGTLICVAFMPLKHIFSFIHIGCISATKVFCATPTCIFAFLAEFVLLQIPKKAGIDTVLSARVDG